MLKIFRSGFLLKILGTAVRALVEIRAQKSVFWKTLLVFVVGMEAVEAAIYFFQLGPLIATFINVLVLGWYQIVMWQIILVREGSFWPSGRFSSALGIIVLPTFLISIVTIGLFAIWLGLGGGAALIIEMLPEELKTPEGFEIAVVYFAFLACLPGIVLGTYAMVRLSPLLRLERTKRLWKPAIWLEMWRRAKPFAWTATLALFLATLFASIPGHLVMNLQMGVASDLVAFAILKVALVVAPALVLKVHMDRIDASQQPTPKGAGLVARPGTG